MPYVVRGSFKEIPCPKNRRLLPVEVDERRITERLFSIFHGSERKDHKLQELNDLCLSSVRIEISYEDYELGLS